MSKLLNSILFVFLMTIFMGTQCYKYYDTPAPKQDFWEKVNLEPYQKAYYIGDTIWLHFFTNSKTLFDTLSNQRLSSNSLQFTFGATLFPKYNTPNNPNNGFCEFITPLGLPVQYVTDQSGTFASFNVGCDGASFYDIKIGVVLKYTGIYVLDLPDAVPLNACSNPTNPYPNSLLHFTYNLSDCNKDVYLSIPSESRQELPRGYSETRINNKVSYALQVN